MLSRIEGGVPPGLVAETLGWLRAQGPGPALLPLRGGMVWSLEVSVPSEFDPQHPACLYAWVRYLSSTMSGVLAGVTERVLVPVEPRTLNFLCVRRGGFVEPKLAACPRAWVGLTTETWPAEWGGTVVGETVRDEPMGAGGVWFVPAGEPVGVGLAERFTETWWLECALKEQR